MRKETDLREVHGSSGAYAVDRDGNAFSRYRRGSREVGEWRPLKTKIALNGYAYVSMILCGVAGWKPLHRIMCETFLGSPPSKSHVAAHANGDKTDNRIVNLRWATRSENERDKRAHRVDNSGERNGQSRLGQDEVLTVKQMIAEGQSGSSIAKRFGVHPNTVYDIKKGRTWASITSPATLPAPTGGAESAGLAASSRAAS